MEITTISASVRFSKALPDGSWKALELSAEAEVSPASQWQMQQSELYHQLTEQFRLLWGNGHESRSPESRAQPSNQAEPAPSTSEAHWCQEHQQEFKQYTKGSATWYSHRLPDGKYCKEARS